LVQLSKSSGVFRFNHGLARDVVYETVRVADRRVLHRRVAEALEEHYRGLDIGDHYEALALHYAGARESARAAHFAELAGDKAASTSALDGARTHYLAALSHLSELLLDSALQRRWLGIVMKWSAVGVYYPSRDQLAILARALEYAKQLNDDSQLAWVEHWTGWIYYALGGAEAAIERLNRSLTLSHKVKDERLTAQALVSIGQCYQAWGRYEPALEHLDRGLEMKRAHPPIGVGGAYALGCRAFLLGDRGDFGRADQHMHEALEILAGTGNALEGSLLGLLGIVQIWQGRWDAALETAARGKATGERVNGPYVLAMCQAISGYARFQAAGDPTALDSMRRAVEWLERRDIHLFLSFCYGQLAAAALEVGSTDEARRYAEGAIERAKKGDPLGEGIAHRILARLAWTSGDFTRARQHQAQAQESGARRGSPRELAHALHCLGELELAAGNRERSRAHLGQAEAQFLALDMPAYAAQSGKALRGLDAS
jgi:tetratricopeptide (TPR) repeat protein